MKLDGRFRTQVQTTTNFGPNRSSPGLLLVPMGSIETPILSTMRELAEAVRHLPAPFAAVLGTAIGRDVKRMSFLFFGKKKGPRTDKKKGADTRKKSGERERNVGHEKGEEHSRNAKGNRGRRGGPGKR